MLEGLSLGKLKTMPPANTTGLVTDWIGKCRLWARGKGFLFGFQSVRFPCIGLGMRWCRHRHLESWLMICSHLHDENLVR